MTTKEQINKQIEDFGTLEDRLERSIKRICDLTSYREPPHINIPPHYLDDDVFIIKTLKDADEFIKSTKNQESRGESEKIEEALEEFDFLKHREAFKAASTLIVVCHKLAQRSGWWNDLNTGEDMRGKRNMGELLCLVHSEISEAMEGHRKNLMDDKLPHRKMLEVELADALIRIFDLAGGYDLDIAGALAEKLEYNESRADHKIENRAKENGKAY